MPGGFVRTSPLEIMKNNMVNKALNFIGGIPDIILRNVPDITRSENPVGYDEYLSNLKFYSPPNWRNKSFLYLPDSAPGFEEHSSRNFIAGIVKVLRYSSRYQVRNPAMESEFNKHKANLSGYFHTWRHDQDEQRPLVLCIHGFMMGSPRRAMRMFKIKRLYDMGVDVGLYTIPHHWKRSDNPPEQHLLCPENVPMTIETVGQNIHDLHSAVLLLKHLGYDKIGIIGASLGGFTAALYATFDVPVDFMFMVVPAINFNHYLSPSRARFSFRVDSEIEEKTSEALQLVSALNYKPVFDVNKISVVMHAGDRLAEAKTTREWIKKWSILNCVEVTGGHWLYFDRDIRGKTWYGRLREMGYIE